MRSICLISSRPWAPARSKLELKDAQSAGQLRPAESEDYKYRYIVMPMRI